MSGSIRPLTSGIASAVTGLLSSIDDLDDYTPTIETLLEFGYHRLASIPQEGSVDFIYSRNELNAIGYAIQYIEQLLSEPEIFAKLLACEYPNVSEFQNDFHTMFRLINSEHYSVQSDSNDYVISLSNEELGSLERFVSFMAHSSIEKIPQAKNLVRLKLGAQGTIKISESPSLYEETRQRVDPDIDYQATDNPIVNLRNLIRLFVQHEYPLQISYKMDIGKAADTILQNDEPTRVLMYFEFEGVNMRLVVTPEAEGDNQIRLLSFLTSAEVDGARQGGEAENQIVQRVDSFYAVAMALQQYLDKNFHRKEPTPLYHLNGETQNKFDVPIGSLPIHATPVQYLLRILCYGRAVESAHTISVTKPENELGMLREGEITVQTSRPSQSLLQTDVENVLGIKFQGEYFKDNVYAKLDNAFIETLHTFQDQFGIINGSRMASRMIYQELQKHYQ